MQQDQLGLRLSRLNEDAGARTTILVSQEGNCLASVGDVSYLDTTSISALVAGMFSATKEVARRVGEDHFSILLQQGEKRNLHISLLGDEIMMVIVFDDYHLIGRVRHEARKSSGQIAELYNSRGVVKVQLADRFKEYAMSRIEQVFKVS
jgi:predicted regulator of Ras-like GTPase activity (Roadblock/LC7/MglB family)